MQPIDMWVYSPTSSVFVLMAQCISVKHITHLKLWCHSVHHKYFFFLILFSKLSYKSSITLFQKRLFWRGLPSSSYNVSSSCALCWVIFGKLFKNGFDMTFPIHRLLSSPDKPDGKRNLVSMTHILYYFNIWSKGSVLRIYYYILMLISLSNTCWRKMLVWEVLKSTVKNMIDMEIWHSP